MPIEQVPFYQKEMIRKCLEKGIPVITATQMIQSMIDNPYPTRAEISDIANAVYDYTDAVMLSGETASGKYPLEAVEYMNKTVVFNEGKLSQDTRLKFNHHEEDVESMICDAAYNLYLSLEAKGLKVAGFMVFTHTGKTARLISSYRPNVPVYAFTPHQDISEQLTVNFGVYPHVQEISHNTEVKKDEVKKALDFLVQHQEFEKGQKVIILHGDTWAQTGGTSTLKIVEI
jgi:pyruvate kinase